MGKIINPYEIDVIIPVFNSEKYLAETLTSVQKQTLLPARIIVVNDGSTDKTAEIIASFSQSDGRIIPLDLPQNRGESAARNAGIETSSAPFVAFLDADDIWLPEKLETQVEVFQQGGPETGFVHSSYFSINAVGDIITDANVVPPTRRGDIFRPLLLRGNFVSGSASSVLVRRTVLDQAGSFDEGLLYGADWDMWIRLARISHVDFTPKAVVGIRAHDQSGSRRAWRERSIEFFQQQHLLIYSKWEKEIIDDRQIKHSIRQRIACDALKVILYRRSPAEALAFYHSLATHESPLMHKLFHNVVHFWLEIFFYIFRTLWRNITRTRGIE